MVKVYGMRLSGNCHKVRMVLDHLGIPFEWQEIDVPSGATRHDAFLAKNPNGKVPVVALDNGRLLWESSAIIQYFGNGSPLWPNKRFDQAETLKWMFFEQSSHEPFVALARYIQHLLPPDNQRLPELPALRAAGHRALTVMEGHLRQTRYFVGQGLTLADVALFAYTHVAEEGGISLSPYPSIREWIERLLLLPGITRLDEPPSAGQAEPNGSTS